VITLGHAPGEPARDALPHFFRNFAEREQSCRIILVRSDSAGLIQWN
jgi:hypothetical protein